MNVVTPITPAEKRTHIVSTDPDEPETKRRAQNRAAQRAFRERKEKHLKDLEMRLAELEVESRSWKSTNMALRNQLSLLEEELHHYRQRARTMPAPPSGNLPKQLPTPPGFSGARSNSSSTNSPSSAITPSTGSGAADDFCQQLSMACGTRDRPVPVVDPPQVSGFITSPTPHIAAEIPSWQLSQAVLGFQQKTDAAAVPGTNPASTSTSLPMTRMASISNGDADNNLYIPDLVSGEYGLFDPLDDILGWDSTLTPDVTQLSSINGSIPSSTGGMDPLPITSMAEIAKPPQASPLAPQQLSPQEQQASLQQPPAISPSMTASMGPQGRSSNSAGLISGLEEVPIAKSRFVSCSDVWDRICAHPRFGEIDINSMCNELRTKAKCSDSGVVMTERDLDKVLSNY